METATSSGTCVTPALHTAFPRMRFATVTVTGVRVSKLKATLSKRRQQDYDTLLSRQELLEQVVACGSVFFDRAGYAYPLANQLARTIGAGFAETRPLVGALMRCEMLTGALMGAHDADALIGGLRLDRVVGESERFDGIRGSIECCEGDIVVRDEEGIVASLFQGPDKRTAVEKGTANVVFPIFDVPGVGFGLDEAERYIVELLEPCSTEVRCARRERDD
jgi:hypothetical protein